MMAIQPELPLGPQPGEPPTHPRPSEPRKPMKVDRRRPERDKVVREAKVMAILSGRGEDGTTWKELAAWQGWLRRQAEQALASLLVTGQVVRLRDLRRNNAPIFVLPVHAAGREVEAYRPRQSRSELERDAYERGWQEALGKAIESIGDDGAATVHGALEVLRRLKDERS